MTLTIELTPTDEARLTAAAQAAGVEPAEVVRKLVTDHLPLLSETKTQEDPMLALFAHWSDEDDALTPEAVAEETHAWDDFKRSINAERDRAGARRVF
jgi:hypothetical protein